MKDYTEIIVILDKSGSMDNIREDAIGGFNSFLDDQKKHPGEANMTVVLFDTGYTLKPAQPIKVVPALNENTYQPSGCTALLDAMGRTITETGRRLARMKEEDRPDKVIVVTITDGEENSSQEHKLSQIADMIKVQEETYKWQFLYLGANVDAFAEAHGLGISKRAAANFKATPVGMRQAYACSSQAVMGYRSSGKLAPNWSAKLDEEASEDLGNKGSSTP